MADWERDYAFLSRIFKIASISAIACLLTGQAFGEADIGETLTAKLGALSSGDTVEVVVTFKGDEPLDDSDLAALDDVS